jgi:hypothetical protein
MLVGFFTFRFVLISRKFLYIAENVPFEFIISTFQSFYVL